MDIAKNLQLVDTEELTELSKRANEKIAEINTKFEVFNDKCVSLLGKVKDIMSSTLDTDPVVLLEVLGVCSSLSYSIGQAAIDAKSYLQIYEILYYFPKKQSYSEADRKLFTQTKTIRQTALVKSLEHAADKINQRITIIQSALKAEMKLYDTSIAAT